jgi:hypothetical protein
MNRIIFLDIDGVLNHELFYTRYPRGKGLRQNLGLDEYSRWLDDIDPVCLKTLDTYCREIDGIQIVISSTWRLGRPVEWFQGLFHPHTAIPIVGVTPHGGSLSCRGTEIKKWLDDNMRDKPHTYVIVDDDSDMLMCQANNFIQVDPYCGLSKNIAYRIAYKLKNP